ncbi:MAG TPA: RNA-binding cell elongation regulator Jag/EloR [Verrucomicrobiae bacterium]|nr:RNA-binding cell elongation regulator Jag/EloR [Verrucomicrobiae bacterium]
MSETGVAEGSGATVAEAVAAACGEAGWDPDQVEVEVLSPGLAGVPGEHLASRAARVRVRPLPEQAPPALAFLRGLLQRMGIEADVSARRVAAPPDRPGDPTGAGEPAPLLLEVTGEDLGVLIGWRGESLRALQTVVNLALGRGGSGGPRVIVDVARYRQRREEAVEAMALRWAARVRRTGQPMTLDPMPPYERRAVHLALLDAPGVRTESQGADPERRVTIAPAADGDEAWL